METDAAFRRSAGGAVLNAVTFENTHRTVIHADGHGNFQFSFRITKKNVIVLFQTDRFRRPVQNR